MTPDQFYELVARMRQAQDKYFKERNRADLPAARQLEREVDQAIKVHRQGAPESAAVQLSFASIEETNNG